MTIKRSIFILACGVSLFACRNAATNESPAPTDSAAVKPVVVTAPVPGDSDDPAIWICTANPDSSLIIGTDKDDVNGGLYVYHLDGQTDTVRTVTGLKRPNNVDVAYGLVVGADTVDIAVTTERDRNMIRIFSVPAMKAIDGGGIEVFKGEEARSPMGIALYKRPTDGAIFAIVSRKTGPAENYLEQYLLTGNPDGQVTASLARKFGKFSGKKEIESIAVDNELGYVYYSDERTGIRKYYADPEKGSEELGLFGQGEFTADNEGISIYKLDSTTGYILVSDQGGNRFNVYPREGEPGQPHSYKRIAAIPVYTQESDGSDVTSISLPGYSGGLFVAMSTDHTFQLYRWEDLARQAGLKIAPRP